METMRYQENKKSCKGAVIAFFSFVIIGGGLVAFAISQEKKPAVIGNNKENTELALVDVKDDDNTIEKDKKEISYDVKDNIINDDENLKLKGNLKLPKIYIENEELKEINDEIDNEYKKRFLSLKDNMKSVENKFTYKVTYNKYYNNVGNINLLSITIYQRVIDDKSKKTTTEKVETYNIDLTTGKKVEETSILAELLGKEYKTKVNKIVKDYVVSKKYISENKFSYTVTGLENYYVKDSKIHMIFNEGEIVDEKYGVLDITIS